jgi:hypothetical protein
MRISSYALPQRAAHFSEGTALVSRFGATPEQREATLALLKTRNRLFDNLRVGGPHGVPGDAFGGDLLAASAFDGVIKAKDNDTVGHEHRH